MMPELSVKKFDISDIEGFLELFRSEYGASAPANPDYVKWKHLDSPFGASTYISLVASGKVVGRAMLQPRPCRIASGLFRAACVTDVIIDRKFRSPPSNFVNITKAAENCSFFDLIFHTSNKLTNRLYTQLLHLPSPISLRAYGFPLRISGLVSKIIGRRIEAIDWLIGPLHWIFGAIAFVVISAAGLDVSLRAMGDDEIDSLCAKCLRQSGPLFVRTKAFLKWRFTDAPLLSATVYRVDQNGQFIGYIVTSKQELDGLTHLVLNDFVLDPDMPLFVQMSLRLWLIQRAIKLKADTLFTMANSLSNIARKCVGFPLVRIPNKLLPHATPIFMRFKIDEIEQCKMSRSTHFTMADIDYF